LPASSSDQAARHLRQPSTPLKLFVTAGQVSDYIGERALIVSLPKVDWLLVDRGYDADRFREALQDKGIRPYILGRKQRETTIKYDKPRYKRRNRIEIMFGRLKVWRALGRPSTIKSAGSTANKAPSIA